MLPMKALAAEIGEPNGVCWPRGKQKGELGGGEPSFLPFTLQRSKPTSPFPLLLGRCLLQAGGGCSLPLAPPAARLPTAPHGEQGGDWCGEGAKRWGRTGPETPCFSARLAILSS